MLRSRKLCELMARPAISASRVQAQRKIGVAVVRSKPKTTTTTTIEGIVSPLSTPPASSAVANGGAPTAEREGVARKRVQWKPSEAHKTSATALRRKRVESDQVRAGVSRRATTSDGLETRPPGLRRRELLGGAAEEPSQEAVNAAPRQSVPGSSALLNKESGERSLASLSATQKFRERRELERLAAAGDAEALEVVRTSGFTTASSGKADTHGFDAEHASSGSGLTPLTVLPVLLALVAAGYCAVNDLLQIKWLSSSLGGGQGSGGAAGQGSSAASSESQLEFEAEGGESAARDSRGNTAQAGLDASRDNGQRWPQPQQQQQQQQQQQSSPSSSSPVLKTIARAVPLVSAPPDARRNPAQSSPGASPGDKGWFDSGAEVEVDQGGAIEGDKRVLNARWGWGMGSGRGLGGREAVPSVPAAIADEAVGITGKVSSAGVGSKEGMSGEGSGDRDGDASSVEQSPRRPLWMQRWRVTTPSGSSP